MKTIKVNNCHTLQRHSTKEGSSSSHPCPCNMLKKLFPTNSRRSSCPTTIGPSFDPAKTIRVHWTLVGWVPHHVISKQTCHCAALILRACCKSSSAEAHSFASHSGRSTRKAEPLEASKSKYYLWSGHLQCACPAYFTISFALGCSQRAKRNRSAPPKGRLQKRSTKFFSCGVSRPPKALVQTSMSPVPVTPSWTHPAGTTTVANTRTKQQSH